MSREGALWIGGVSLNFNCNSVKLKSYQTFIFHSQLEGYMDEAFLKSALQQVGEYNVISIKVMKNKFTNEPASYGFINFDNDNHALTAMHKLNGKIIPSTNPVSYLLKVFVKLILIDVNDVNSFFSLFVSNSIIRAPDSYLEKRTIQSGLVTSHPKWTICNFSNSLLIDLIPLELPKVSVFHSKSENHHIPLLSLIRWNLW